MAKKWHKKHISTKWGVAIIGFLLLSVAVLIPVLRENQDIRSKAMYYENDDTKVKLKSCGSQGGRCMPSNIDSRAIERIITRARDGATVYCSKVGELCYKLKSSCAAAGGVYQSSSNYHSSSGTYGNSCYSGYVSMAKFFPNSGGKTCCLPKLGCEGSNRGRAGCACRSSIGNSGGELKCKSGLSCMVDGGNFNARDLDFINPAGFPCRNSGCTERYVGFIGKVLSRDPDPLEDHVVWAMDWYIRKPNGSWTYLRDTDKDDNPTAESYVGSCARKPN